MNFAIGRISDFARKGRKHVQKRECFQEDGVIWETARRKTSERQEGCSSGKVENCPLYDQIGSLINHCVLLQGQLVKMFILHREHRTVFI